MLKLKAFTLSSAEALWLKGVREGALPVARRARSNSVRPRASQLRIVQNSLKPMVNKTPIKLVPCGRWLHKRGENTEKLRDNSRAALLEREASPVLDRWLADVYSHDRSPTRGLT